jgi:hypothetical protein
MHATCPAHPPVPSYSTDIWTMTKNEKYKQETAEMNFLRSIAGASLQDHKRGTGIKKEFSIFNLNERIEYYKQTWEDHLI